MSISRIIRSRRSIFPPNYSDSILDTEVIWEILENANWAPSHKLTQPWRFVVVNRQKLKELSDYVGTWYQKNTPSDQFSEMTLHKMTGNIQKAGAIIAIGMVRNEVVDEWEELAAVSMAVQNMWLTCTEKGIGSYWGTSKAAMNAGSFLGFEDEVKCLGFFFMGYVKDGVDVPKSARSPIESKVSWL